MLLGSSQSEPSTVDGHNDAYLEQLGKSFLHQVCESFEAAMNGPNICRMSIGL